jgi:DNA-binding transcriptional MerR regulator
MESFPSASSPVPSGARAFATSAESSASSAAASDSAASQSSGRYAIGELCEAFGVTARALRFYEDEQLITPERRGTSRFYSDRDRARLSWILRGKRVGFSLSEIRELLDLYDVGDQRQTQRRVTIERCQQRIETLRRQKDDIDTTIAELEDFLKTLGSPAGRSSIDDKGSND